MDILQGEIERTLKAFKKLGECPAKENEKPIAIVKMALEKQIEEEPINGRYCPKCGHRILQQRQLYCGYCGQRVKRSE